MIRIFPLPLLASLCLACADGGAAEPQPSPAELEQLLASLEASPPEQETIDPEDRAKAERLLPTIEKMQPEKINPGVAGALLAR
jgi:hypothetical protein